MRARDRVTLDPDAACAFNASSTRVDHDVAVAGHRRAGDVEDHQLCTAALSQFAKSPRRASVRYASTLPCATAGHSHADAASRSRKRASIGRCVAAKRKRRL